MQTPPSLFLIEDFARMYIQPFVHHNEVKEEALADAFREFAGLSPFPTLSELVDLLYRANVDFKALPSGVGASLPGVNVWAAGRRPAIHINTSLSKTYTETTICHELREVIEQAFGRVKPGYAGIDTHDNKRMNPRSDRFARNLLMPRLESQSLLWLLGFDFVGFADATGRSLSSVMVRAQDICAARHGWGITGGLWLFEQAWQDGRRSEYIGFDDCIVRHRAHLRGFSIGKRSGATAVLARRIFPTLGSAVGDFAAPRTSFARRHPVIKQVGGFDLFEAHDYLVISEPLLDHFNVPRRVFTAAIRLDFAPRLNPWLARLAVEAEQGTYQTA